MPTLVSCIINYSKHHNICYLQKQFLEGVLKVTYANYLAEGKTY